MATEATQCALDDPEQVRAVVAAALVAALPEDDPAGWATAAIEAIWRCGWRPARLVELMQETPDERAHYFDGNQADE